jgi:CheY-like chemotaxis protein
MLNQYHYLYVEDDPLSREIMQMIMGTAMGIETLTMFEDSQDFLARVEAKVGTPTVFLLDIHVKPYDGFEALQILRSTPAYRSAKIIALTASVMNEEIEKLRQSGFDGAIAKPISVQSFPALLERMINGEAIWYVA